MPSVQLKPTEKCVELRYRCESTGSVVCFHSEVLQHFHAHRQQGRVKTEVGGQLFAEFVRDEVRVTRATGPNNTDKRGWCWFNPDRRRQNAEIRHLFEQGLHFVGDWHTHPENNPTPSSLDLESMEDCFKKSRHQLKAFVMVIVGRGEFPGGLWVSVHTRSRSERLKLMLAGPVDLITNDGKRQLLGKEDVCRKT